MTALRSAKVGRAQKTSFIHIFSASSNFKSDFRSGHHVNENKSAVNPPPSYSPYQRQTVPSLHFAACRLL